MQEPEVVEHAHRGHYLGEALVVVIYAVDRGRRLELLPDHGFDSFSSKAIPLAEPRGDRCGALGHITHAVPCDEAPTGRDLERCIEHR